jgi:hypothetical protein
MERKQVGKYNYNYTPLYLKIKKQCKFKVKLNNYWTNLHKY